MEILYLFSAWLKLTEHVTNWHTSTFNHDVFGKIRNNYYFQFFLNALNIYTDPFLPF